MVKIHSISIRAPEDGTAPRTIKLFPNAVAVGFDSASSMEAAQVLTLSPSQMNGDLIPLKFVKFQNVNSLTVFFEDNQDDEEKTTIQRLALFGAAKEGTDMSQLKKMG